jgi:hypothetical protein
MPTSTRSAAAVSDEPESVYAGLAMLRAELRRSYPLVDRGRLERARRAAGLAAWPEAFLVRSAPSGGMLAALYRRVSGNSRRRSHVLFSPRYYELANPDVAESGVDPWLHYQVFGHAEGRPPHPFIDPGRLAHQLAGERPGIAVDRYLTEPRLWALSPGAYVDVESFVAEGPWDGRTHPLVQLLSDYAVDPWVRIRLGTIDLGAAAAPDDMRLAAGLLALRNPGLAAIAGLSTWLRGDSARFVPGQPLRVVPGFFLGGSAGELAAGGRAVLNADATVIRTSRIVVALDAGPEHRCDTLRYLLADLSDDELRRRVAGFGADDLVAPATEDQSRVLSDAGVRTLPLGRQATVIAAGVDVVGATQGRA